MTRLVRTGAPTAVVLLATAAVALLFLPTGATDIKWTPNRDVSGDNRAATAPRSQRYWDEHGIERPDYAKTDAELAAERGGVGGAGKPWFLLLVAALTLAYLVKMGRMSLSDVLGGGGRLGGGGGGGCRVWGSLASGGARGMSSEEARRARLAKFDCGVGGATPKAD